ncbi:hypothetical protein V8G54_020981 [Vigna mungo]|uniref:Chromo domain-containing protein n=1 Tax=Vigna mungo TaxID=3915 RepID=A0AAQ3NCL5_VIGMU
MKHWAYSYWRVVHFNIGDWVYVRFLKEISDVAYKLDLLSIARGPFPSPQPLSLPFNIEDNEPVLTPTTILDWKLPIDTDVPQQLVLIQWQDLSLEEATWEPWAHIQAQFHLEDKVNLEDGGDVKFTSTNRPIMIEQPTLENIQ